MLTHAMHLLHRRSVLLLLVLLPFVASAQMTYQTQEPGMMPKKREIFFYGMRAYPFGKIPQHARIDALARTTSTMQSFGAGRGLASITQWQPIGPFTIGGRVNTAIVHPRDGNTVWIGAADGGVWKTTDGGGSWKAVMDNENAIAMGALALDPQKPEVIYAGTGEMSSNIDGYTGAGIFKSTDGGNSWRGLGLTNVGAFSAIVVHPQNGSLIYAGATKNNGGFYRSTDGGATWSRTFDQSVADVTVNPANQLEVWASTMSKGIYRSTDGGLSFTLCSGDIARAFNSTVQRISVKAAPSSPNILYALTFETDGANENQVNHSRIYKSVNSGLNWQNIYNDAPADFLNVQQFGSSGAQGWYNNVLAVSPADPNVVVAGGVSIVRTLNGGTSWTYIDSYAGGPHPDQHAIAFDPTNPNRIYLGNDGGMYRSDNKGTSYQMINNDLAITQFYAMGLNQKSPQRTGYGGTQDNGTVNSGSVQFKGGDGAYVAIDRDGQYLYAENYSGLGLERIELATGRGTSLMNGIERVNGEYEEASWAAPLTIDPNSSNVLWHLRRSVYLSISQGNPWIRTAGRFPAGVGTAVAVSPINGDVVFAGSDRGEVLVSTDGSETWMDRTRAPGMPNRAVTDFALSPSSSSTAYMSVSGFYADHVFKTTDYGATWQSIGAGLPDIPVNALALHPDDENIIYAGTDIGMFITIDGGKSWASYNQGLPRVVVADLEVHRSSGTLVMASHGRSMWEIPLEKPSLIPSITSPIGGETWMAGTFHTISWSGFGSASVRIDYSLDDGTTWDELARDVSGTGFLWHVFDTTALFARLRVTAMADAGITATSRSFSITSFVVGGLLTTNAVPSAIPYGLAYDGEFLWATDYGSRNLLKLDPNTLAMLGTVTMNLQGGDSLFTDIAYVPTKDHFFIHKVLNSVDANPGGYLYEVDRQGNQVGRWLSPCTYPIGLAWLGGPGSTRQQLIATDRNGAETIYFIDPNNPATPVVQKARVRNVRYGPRGATQGPDGTTFYQVITDFTGDILQSAVAEKMNVETQALSCAIPLSSPVASTGAINARGIEFDPRDSSLWVSDYNGNIYKIVGCDTRISAPPPPHSGVKNRTVPTGMTLSQNIPNPFSTSTTISFTVPSTTRVKLLLHDISGRLVATLADDRFEAGEHRIAFAPAGLPSGLYTCSMVIENGATITRRMVHLH